MMLKVKNFKFRCGPLWNDNTIFQIKRMNKDLDKKNKKKLM